MTLCYHSLPGQTGELNAAKTSSSRNDDDIRLLSMRQRELTSPGSTMPRSAPPPETSPMAFITLDITPGELAALYEREDAERGGGDGESREIEQSQEGAPDLPPRTHEMLQIVASDGSSDGV